MSLQDALIHLGRALDDEAARLATELRRSRAKLVLAESCTGGMAAAALARIPGVSNHFCGSAVTYRDDTKARWLGVSRALLTRHGAVSAPVALAMAEGALRKTPEARIAAAITGHFGPGAPADQDGLVFVAIRAGNLAHVEELRLSERASENTAARRKRSAKFLSEVRRKRQLSASLAFLFMVRSVLKTRGHRS